MANNALQFSLLVPLKTKSAARWVTTSLLELDGSNAPASPSNLARRFAEEGWDDYLGFEWSLEPAPDDQHVGALWIYAEEAGDPDQVAVVLEEYLKRFAPTGVITFTWACTCSKMRVGEFSGGAAVVTAKGSTFMDAAGWAEDLAAKFLNTAPETSP